MIAIIKPPLAPMEAKLVARIPTGDQWQYEPKWDGFRCIALRRGPSVELQSKSGQPLARYFPELVHSMLKLRPSKFVLDGEIVVPVDGALSFDALLMRIHPARSRIERLARETPAWFIAFDLLGDEKGRTLTGLTLEQRRRRLEVFARAEFRRRLRLMLSPATTSIAIAKRWFEATGTNLDGIVAKRRDLPYQAGARTGMQKIKKRRTAECVVGGFRYARKGRIVGSLLLGLYDDSGLLHHVGFTSSLTREQRRALTARLRALRLPPERGGGFTGRAPGGPSRWSTGRSGQWEALAPKLVVEVQWDHFSGGRFRHGTKFLRWRPDKSPRQCTMELVQPRARRPTRPSIPEAWTA